MSSSNKATSNAAAAADAPDSNKRTTRSMSHQITPATNNSNNNNDNNNVSSQAPKKPRPSSTNVEDVVNDDDNIEEEEEETDEDTDIDDDDDVVDLNDKKYNSKKKKPKKTTTHPEHWKPQKSSMKKLERNEIKFTRQDVTEHKKRPPTSEESTFITDCNNIHKGKPSNLLDEFVTGLVADESETDAKPRLWFHPIYERGVTSISDMFDDNFIDLTTKSEHTNKNHRRYKGSNDINYYRPTIDAFKAWINSHPPKETIVNILILQEYIQKVLKDMFSDEFRGEQVPDKFYTNISYIAFRNNEAFDRINSELKYNDILNQLWEDQFAIKVGASNDFYRFNKKMLNYRTYTSNGDFYFIGIGILPGSGLNHYKVEQLLQFQLIEDWESGEWFNRQIRSRLISILKKLGFIIIIKGVYKTRKQNPSYPIQEGVPDTVYLMKPNLDDDVIKELNNIYNYYIGDDNDNNVRILRYINCIKYECKIGSTSNWDKRKCKYLWSRSTSNGWVYWKLASIENAHEIEERFGTGLIEMGISMDGDRGENDDFNYRWETKEWFLIAKDEMGSLLKKCQEQLKLDNEIEGPLFITRDQRKLVAAVNMRAADVRLYIERDYFKVAYLEKLICGNKYKLIKHRGR
jgi:hypothetical protein